MLDMVDSRSFLFSFLFGALALLVAVRGAPPPNDDCSSATIVTLGPNDTTPLPFPINLVDATPTPGVGNASSEAYSVCFGGYAAEALQDDVWFKFTPPAGPNFRVQFSMTNDFLVEFFIRDLGIGFDPCPMNNTEIVSPIDRGISSYCLIEQTHRFTAIPGNAYTFRIGRLNSTNPTGTATFAALPPSEPRPAGDTCPTAVEIPAANAFPIQFTTDFITPNHSITIPPPWCDTTRDNSFGTDIWHTFDYSNVTTTSGAGVPLFTIDTCGSTSINGGGTIEADSVMQVFSAATYLPGGCPPFGTDTYLFNQPISAAPDDNDLWCADDNGINGYPACPDTSDLRSSAVEVNTSAFPDGPLLIRLSSWRNSGLDAFQGYRFYININCVDSVDASPCCYQGNCSASDGTDGADGADGGGNDGGGDGGDNRGALIGGVLGGVLGPVALLLCCLAVVVILVVICLAIIIVIAVSAAIPTVLRPLLGGSSDSEDESEMDTIISPVVAGEDGFTFKRIQMDEITIKRKLGQGAFGVVYKGVWHKQPVAVKIVNIRGNDEDVLLEFKREAEVMHLLGFHRRLVKFIGAVVDGGEYALVTGFCERGSLYDLLVKKSDPIEHDRIVMMARDAAEGICHLHSEGVVHRDIAARNILVKKDWSVQVADFGMSRIFDKDEGGGATKSNIGPVRYMAPEALSEEHIYSEKSDVFSFGVLLWEMLERRDPWEGVDAWRVAAKVVDGERLDVPARDPVLADIMESCWLEDPNERPDMSSIYDSLCQHYKTLNPDADETESVSECFEINTTGTSGYAIAGSADTTAVGGNDSASTFHYAPV